MIGCGMSGMVHRTPCGTMVKKSIAAWRVDDYLLRMNHEHLRNEIAIYKHLPQNHPRLLRFCDSFDDGAGVGADNVWLTLEYMPNGTLMEYLRGYAYNDYRNRPRSERDVTEAEFAVRVRPRHDSIPLRQRARWCLEAADGVVLLHAHNIIHAGIKPENMGLDASLSVRLLDFAGSAAPGGKALTLESTGYYLPRASWEIVNATTDCFALGSSIYHIVTGYRPHDGVEDDEVDARFERGEFPDLSGKTREHDVTEAGNDDTTGVSPVSGQLLFAETINKCWHGAFATSADVLDALKKEVLATFNQEDLSFIEDASGLNLRDMGGINWQ
ncbi:hypothetical protein SCUCBS95973_002861 [Sporothrix curviconia]|uniref:Protein kinase domain-containing protein n=1 Tax=Sporothrix curviconia TaxID=1260050 RepID=A0ABP0BAI2_9PEZI